VINPDNGYIATANNKVVGSGYPYHITDFWAQPYRYERIVEMLEEKDDFTVEDIKNMQLDTENLYAKEFLPHLIESVKKQHKLKDIVRMMEDWDYQDSISEGAPLVFHLWMIKIQDQLFKKSMPADVYQMMPGKYNITDEILRQAYRGKPGEFVDKAGGIDELVTKALEETVKED
jgi:Protein related to penicillin acylase